MFFAKSSQQFDCCVESCGQTIFHETWVLFRFRSDIVFFQSHRVVEVIKPVPSVQKIAQCPGMTNHLSCTTIRNFMSSYGCLRYDHFTRKFKLHTTIDHPTWKDPISTVPCLGSAWEFHVVWYQDKRVPYPNVYGLIFAKRNQTKLLWRTTTLWPFADNGSMYAVNYR